MNKLKFSLLVAFFAMLLYPIGSFAAVANQIISYTTNGVQLFYKLINPATNVSTVSFVGKRNGVVATELTIPPTFSAEGQTWTVIRCEQQAGYNCNGVTKITLPETIESFGVKPFVGAKFTSPINLYAAFKQIESTGFGDFIPVVNVSSDNTTFSSGANGELYSKDGTVLYSVPTVLPGSASDTYTVDSKVTDIRLFAFWTNTNLKKIVLPPNLSKVATGVDVAIAHVPATLEAYEIASGGTTNYKTEDGVLLYDDGTRKELVSYPKAKKTEDYTVPAGIKTIVSGGMWEIPALKALNLNELDAIQPSSIAGNANLLTVTLTKTMTFASINGAIVRCDKIREYRVADGNPNISAQDGVIYSADKKRLIFYPPAREGATYEIPSTVESIENAAFRNAQNITSVTIPTTVKSIGSGSFANISKLSKVEFLEPSQVTSIGGNAFGNTEALKELTLPTSLVTLNNIVFNNSAFTTMNVPDGSQLKTINDNVFSLNKNITHFNFLGSSVLETIGNQVFENMSKLEAFKLPATIRRIGPRAFWGCTSLKEITFPEGAQLDSIGQGTFGNCGLEHVDIAGVIKDIRREAFLNCQALTEVNISKGTEVISSEAFKGCSNLAVLDVNPENANYSSVRGYLLNKAKTTLVYFPEGSKLITNKFVNLAPSITTIGDYAFFQNKHIEKIVLPNKLTKLGQRAFGLCTNLKEIVFLNEKMIPEANINTTLNGTTFDNGKQAGIASMYPNIKITVRKNLFDDYKNSSFYQQFQNGSNPDTTFVSGTEEYVATEDNNVALINTTRSDYTFVVPETFTRAEATGPKTYNVTAIGDYLLQNVGGKGVKEVVVKHNVGYIGAKAFITNIADNTSDIQNVFFVARKSTRNQLASKYFYLDETGSDYSEVATATNVYVRPDSLASYQKNWTKYIRSGERMAVDGENKHLYKPTDSDAFDYHTRLTEKIPLTVTAKYGTFAREFDVDFEPFYKENGKSEVVAFVASSEVDTSMGGDYGNAPYHVKMESIDKHSGVPSYHYVPATTGVLLKVMDSDDTEANFYYTIGTQDNTPYTVTDNAMNGIVVNNQDVDGTANPIYFIKKGTGTFFKRDRVVLGAASNNVHKAYLQLPATTPIVARSLVMKFDSFFERNIDTGIDSIGIDPVATDENNEGAIYTLGGQKVTQPLQPGVYIRNGKKFIVK